MPGPFLTIDLPDETATAELGEDLAAILAVGDVVALSGDLGAGKTALARATLRAALDDDGLEVPSPTFTIVQTYEGARFPLAHFDLYRLADASELDEIGFDEARTDGAVLIEWPERAGDRLPPESLTIDLALAGHGRRASFTGDAAWQARLTRSRAVRALLDKAGWTRAARRFVQGDASTRRFERIRAAGETAILMDWPKPLVPPVRDSRAAYRAQDVTAVLATTAALADAGLSVPEVLASDIASGLLLIEDFGREGVLAADGSPDPARYDVAVDMLAAIHGTPRPDTLPVPGGGTHRLLALDETVVMADLALFTDWYVPHVTGAPASDEAVVAFREIWRRLLAPLATAGTSWVLFDVQSPNLFWLAARDGIRRIGLIDFQDMFVGPPAYDVVSLCQDHRVTVPVALETALRDRYVATRHAAGAPFDVESFAGAYAILGAARALKNMGVFARLAEHVGKPHYLQHLPRLADYLARNLSHAVLSELSLWYERHLPSESQAAR